MNLTGSQVAALREIEGVLPGRVGVVIGAAALGFYIDMRWRQTADVDLVLAIDLDDLPAIARLPGWKHDPAKEHAFVSPEGTKLDILPAGPELLARGSITWPSGHVMSLVGMDLAFSHFDSHKASDGGIIRVAPPAVVTVLKMASYCDRPLERERDLDDIAHLLDVYVDDDSDRRWNEALEIQEFELAPAYLLGLDVGSLARDPHRVLIDRFLGRVGSLDSAEHAQMRRRGPTSWRRSEESLLLRLRAFGRGLSSAGWLRED